MKARLFATLLAASVAVPAASAKADGSSDDTESPSIRVVPVDYASIPVGVLPSMAAPDESPDPGTLRAISDLEVRPAGEPAHKPVRKHKARRKKMVRPRKGARAVEIKKVGEIAGLLYAPSSDTTDFDAHAPERAECGPERQGTTVLRWEKLRQGKGDEARLEISDVSFDEKTCALRAGPVTSVPLKAIASNDGKPWLYAMRSETSVTFVFPAESDLTTDAMAGSPIQVRGDFTRVTLPLGRWGSGTISAQLQSFAIDRVPDGNESGSAEIAIELVQTVSERQPTLVVRTQTAGPEAPTALRSFE